MYQAARSRIFDEEDLETAIAILDRYLKLAKPSQEPSRADAHWRKGVAYNLLKSTEKARASFNKALSLNNNHKEAKSSLAKLK